MSGGSHDYGYRSIEQLADIIERDLCPLRRAFAAHLRVCAEAAHDIEWVDSADYGPGDDHAAIHAALGADRAGLLDTLIADARECITALERTIAEAETAR